MKALHVEITYISDFRTRATSTRVAQQSTAAFACKNSRDGIAKRNIPVDFMSAISLRELNKNISPRSRQARRAAKWNVCTSFCPSHPACLSPLLFPSKRTRVHNPRTRVGSPGPTHIRACRWDHVSHPEESGTFVGSNSKILSVFFTRFTLRVTRKCDKSAIFSIYKESKNSKNIIIVWTLLILKISWNLD